MHTSASVHTAELFTNPKEMGMTPKAAYRICHLDTHVNLCVLSETIEVTCKTLRHLQNATQNRTMAS